MNLDVNINYMKYKGNMNVFLAFDIIILFVLK